MRVIVQLRSQRELPADVDPAQTVSDATTAHGVELEPLHPGTDDPTLARYLTAEIEDPDKANQFVDALGGHPAVEAAYVKPPDELP